MSSLTTWKLESPFALPKDVQTHQTKPCQKLASQCPSEPAASITAGDVGSASLQRISSEQQSSDGYPTKDLEAQLDTAERLASDSTAMAAQTTTIPAATQSSYMSSEDDDDEQAALYRFSEELRTEDPPAEPWVLEMSRLRRIYILWLNKRLALCRKSILESQKATDDDMKDLGEVLHLQAEAIRDLETIRALDFLTPKEQERLSERTKHHLRETAASHYPDVDPFQTENYRRLQPAKQEVMVDGVREMLRTYLPKQISWSKEERLQRRDLYDTGEWKPEKLSSIADRLARFIVAMGGALFILVPIYIMALNQNPAKNLITTTVAIVLFALVCSIPLKLANDQLFSATVGYAAVLMVFVGLTSSPSPSS